jgi:general secretion pathway protein K
MAEAEGLGARGIALVVVLWMLTLMAVIAASFTTTTRTETRLARNLVENAKAEALADAAVHRAIVGLLDGDPDARWAADGTVYEFAMDDGTAWITIQDETGKIDLNAGSQNLIATLLDAADVPLGEADSLSDAIIDYRDTDDQRRPSGAEDDDYRDAGLPWGAKDRPFEAVEELRRVLGMTPELYDRISPYLTVYTGQRGVNAAAFQAGMLAADDDEDVADEEAGTDTENADTDQDAAPEVAPVDLDRLAGVTGGRRSRRALRIYSVRAEATLDSGALFVREAVVRLTGRAEQPWLVHAWRQGRMDPLAH